MARPILSLIDTAQTRGKMKIMQGDSSKILSIGTHETPTGFETQTAPEFCAALAGVFPDLEKPEGVYCKLPSTMAVRMRADNAKVLFEWRTKSDTGEFILAPHSMNLDEAILMREFLRYAWAGYGWLAEKPEAKRGRPKKGSQRGLVPDEETPTQRVPDWAYDPNRPSAEKIDYDKPNPSQGNHR